MLPSPERLTKSAHAAGGTGRPSARSRLIPICATAAPRSWNPARENRLLLTLPLYALDQLTKLLVLRFIDPYEPRTIIPDFFSLVHVTNTGAAFGSFRNNNSFFIALSCVALVVVTVLLMRKEPRDPWRRFALGLLLAGILGNLTDRLLHGHVIDFLLFDLHLPFAHPWPAFNVADSCICIAVVCFMIYSFRDSRAYLRSVPSDSCLTATSRSRQPQRDQRA